METNVGQSVLKIFIQEWIFPCFFETFFISCFIFGVNNQLNAQENLLSGWDGNGITGLSSKPNDVSWLNNLSSLIPWNTANSTSGCRFRDAGVGFVKDSYLNESDSSANNSRQLMLRWDAYNYVKSEYAFPVQLDSGKYYTLELDFVCGGSTIPPKYMYLTVNSTPSFINAPVLYNLKSSNSTNLYKHFETLYLSNKKGTQYLTFKGQNNTYSWFGIANLKMSELKEPIIYNFPDSLEFSASKTYSSLTFRGLNITKTLKIVAPPCLMLSIDTIPPLIIFENYTIDINYNKALDYDTYSGYLYIINESFIDSVFYKYSGNKYKLISIKNSAGFLTPTFHKDTLSYKLFCPPNTVLEYTPESYFSQVVSSYPYVYTDSMNISYQCISDEGQDKCTYNIFATLMPINYWNGSGDIHINSSSPFNYGWNCSNPGIFTSANSTTVGSVRYMDNPEGFTQNDTVTWNGRLLYLRWDGALNPGQNYSYPLMLKKNKKYTLKSKFAWVDNGLNNLFVNIDFSVNKTSNISSDNIGLAELNIENTKRKNFHDLNMTFSPCSDGLYYLNIVTNSYILGAISDITLTEESMTPDSISGPGIACQGETDVLYTYNNSGCINDYYWELPTGFTGKSFSDTVSISISQTAQSGFLRLFSYHPNNSNVPELIDELFIQVNPTPQLSDVYFDSTLVAYYPFDYSFKDQSRYGNHPSEIYNVSLVTGKIGNALKFNGYFNPGYIRIPNSESLHFQQNGVSFSLWTRLDSVPGMSYSGSYDPTGYHCLFAKDHDQHGIYCEMAYRGNTKFFTTMGDSKGNSMEVSNGGISGYKPGDWIHLTYICSSAFIKLYINGEYNTISYKNFDFTVADTRDLILGRFVDWWYPLNGAIDELKIFNRELTSNEVLSLYLSRNSVDDLLRITGPESICSDSVHGAIYSSPLLKNINRYRWILPDGKQIDTIANKIRVDFPTGMTNGIITVSGLNECGEFMTSKINVSIKPKPETPVISRENFTLISSSETGNQWYNSKGIIPGETGKYFQVTENEVFYVIVNPDSCSSSKSNSISVINTDVFIVHTERLKVYPNPANDYLYIETIDWTNVEILDLTGKCHYKNDVFQNSKIDLKLIPSGIYLLKTHSLTQTSTIKLIIK